MSDYSKSHHGTHFSDPGIRIGVGEGASANSNIAIAGIKTIDQLLSVFRVDIDATDSLTAEDVSDEASITSDGNIQCDTTDTSDDVIIVLYQKGHPNG
jgi:hypothetical protein